MYKILITTQHDARQRCPALIVLKEDNNNNNNNNNMTCWTYASSRTLLYSSPSKITINVDYEHLQFETDSTCLLYELITTDGLFSSWSRTCSVLT